MNNWREIGEVPDSDDEFDFGQEEDEHEIVFPSSSTQILAASSSSKLIFTKPPHDIWDIPSSQSQNNDGFSNTKFRTSPTARHHPSTPTNDPAPTVSTLSSPLSSPPPEDTEEIDSQITPRSCIPSYPAQSINSHVPSLAEKGFVVAPPSSPSATVSYTPSNFAQTSKENNTKSTRSNIQIILPSAQPTIGTATDDTEEADRQVALRLSRSLRPRKPIQEHPYLLENAQYSKFMKSHGVQPEKIRQPESPKKVQANNDSQDSEYVQKDSGQDVPIASQESEDPIAANFLSSPFPVHPVSSGRSETADEDNDLPSLSQILQNPQLVTKSIKRAEKRKSSPLPTTARKKLKIPKPLSEPIRRHNSTRSEYDRIYEIPISSEEATTDLSAPEFNGNLAISSPYVQFMQHGGKLDQRYSSGTALVVRTPEKDQSRTLINLTADLDERNSNFSSDSSTKNAISPDSSSESEIIRRVGRRIRGVLPASWLRLDSKQDQRPSRPAQVRGPTSFSQRIHRKGVAQRRQRPVRPTASGLDLFDDEDDDSVNDNEFSLSSQKKEYSQYISSIAQSGLPLATEDEERGRRPIFIGEEDSDMEDNQIDAMLSSIKRSGRHSSRPRKRKSATFRSAQGPSLKQLKITNHLPDIKSSGTRIENSLRRKPRKQSIGENKHHTRRCQFMPPLLSILDVVENEPPQFIRIAARTARKRTDKGKSDPSQKLIQLATRADNVDANSVLRDWREDRIQPRITTPGHVGLSSLDKEPLHLRPTNSTRSQLASSARISNQPPRKFSKQQTLQTFVTTNMDSKKHGHTVSKAKQPVRKTKGSRKHVLRPAVLETLVPAFSDKHSFRIKKFAIDSLFLKPTIEQNISSFTTPFIQTLQIKSDHETTPNSQIQKSASVTRSRFRKQFQPQYVDIDEPQYTRTNDPLPVVAPVVMELADPCKNKLRGLGPYGSNYTHHFEIFPLDFGVFFHSSTLIGSGRLKIACERSLHTAFGHHKIISFILDNKTLRWGVWNDTVASEFGILVDWVLDHGQVVDSSGSSEVVAAIGFVLEYIQDALRLDVAENMPTFLSRFTEVVNGFLERITEVNQQTTGIPILSRLLISILAVMRACCSNGSLFTYAMALQDTLKTAAIQLVRGLLNAGFKPLEDLYRDCKNPTFRERGIRSSAIVAEGWVTLMHVMTAADIARTGFWDLVCNEMLGNQITSCLDAQIMESWWESLFLLLPLAEIDSSGVLVSRRRFANPLEGWTIPSQILKRIFALYKINQRQPPSFNSYVEALFSRCHYLVSQWGWKNATGIIGAIFDFFGNIEFRHLRNEQVDCSPAFLDQQPGVPVDINAHDCSFHIFLKLLTLLLRQLYSEERRKETKNLVARITPNHNRHFDRENSVDLRDLAALRNHHDLLCTLFCFVPPELRPSPTLIKSLVSPDTAHREACCINLGAWKRLAKFIVRERPFSLGRFEPIARWYQDIHNSAVTTVWAAAADVRRAVESNLSDVLAKPRSFIFHPHHEENLRTAISMLLQVTDAAVDVLASADGLWEFSAMFDLVPPGHMLCQILSEDEKFSLSRNPQLLHCLIIAVVKPLRTYFDNFLQPVLDGLIDPDQVFGGKYREAFIRRHGQYMIGLWPFVTFLLRSGAIESISGTKTLQDEIQQYGFKAIELLGSWAAFKGGDDASLLYKLPSHGFLMLSRLTRSPVHELNWYERQSMARFLIAFLASSPPPPTTVLPGAMEQQKYNLVHDNMLAFGLQVLMTILVLPQRCHQEEHAVLLERLRKAHPLLTTEGPTFSSIDTYDDASQAFRCLIHQGYVQVEMLSSSPSAAATTTIKTVRELFAPALLGAMQAIKSDLQNPEFYSQLLCTPKETEAYQAFVRRAVSAIRELGSDLGVEVDNFFLSASAWYSPDPQDPRLLGPVLDRYLHKLEQKSESTTWSGGAETQMFYFLYNSFLGLLADYSKEDNKAISMEILQTTAKGGYSTWRGPITSDSSSSSTAVLLGTKNREQRENRKEEQEEDMAIKFWNQVAKRIGGNSSYYHSSVSAGRDLQRERGLINALADANTVTNTATSNSLSTSTFKHFFLGTFLPATILASDVANGEALLIMQSFFGVNLASTVGVNSQLLRPERSTVMLTKWEVEAWERLIHTLLVMVVWGRVAGGIKKKRKQEQSLRRGQERGVIVSGQKNGRVDEINTTTKQQAALLYVTLDVLVGWKRMLIRSYLVGSSERGRSEQEKKTKVEEKVDILVHKIAEVLGKKTQTTVASGNQAARDIEVWEGLMEICRKETEGFVEDGTVLYTNGAQRQGVSYNNETPGNSFALGKAETFAENIRRDILGGRRWVGESLRGMKARFREKNEGLESKLIKICGLVGEYMEMTNNGLLSQSRDAFTTELGRRWLLKECRKRKQKRNVKNIKMRRGEKLVGTACRGVFEKLEIGEEGYGDENYYHDNGDENYYHDNGDSEVGSDMGIEQLSGYVQEDGQVQGEMDPDTQETNYGEVPNFEDLDGL